MDRLALQIVSMERSELVDMLKSLNCDFPIDFTDEYLDSISLERLRHVVLVASLHAHSPVAASA